MKIQTILDLIDLGSIALPEFQRGYVWKRDHYKSNPTAGSRPALPDRRIHQAYGFGEYDVSGRDEATLKRSCHDAC